MLFQARGVARGAWPPFSQHSQFSRVDLRSPPASAAGPPRTLSAIRPFKAVKPLDKPKPDDLCQKSSVDVWDLLVPPIHHVTQSCRAAPRSHVTINWRNTMAKRHKIPQKASQKNFTRQSRAHGKNFLGAPMRGGIRL